MSQRLGQLSGDTVILTDLLTTRVDPDNIENFLIPYLISDIDIDRYSKTHKNDRLEISLRDYPVGDTAPMVYSDGEYGILISESVTEPPEGKSFFKYFIFGSFTKIDNDFIELSDQDKRKRLIVNNYEGLLEGDFCIPQLQARLGSKRQSMFDQIEKWHLMLDLLLDTARHTDSKRVAIPVPGNIFWQKNNLHATKSYQSRYMNEIVGYAAQRQNEIDIEFDEWFTFLNFRK